MLHLIINVCLLGHNVKGISCCALKFKKIEYLSRGRGFQAEGTASAKIAWQERVWSVGAPAGAQWERGREGGLGRFLRVFRP